MVKTANTSHSKGGKYIGNDVKMSPGQELDKDVIVTVTDNPVHIFGMLPEGDTVSVYRVYDGKNECADIPDVPVMCRDGCTPLMLFNEENPDCPSGRFIQDDIWLFYEGRYKLVYTRADAGTVIPDDTYVWSKPDTLVTKIGINLPLCGENTCPPLCTAKHIIELESDSTPTHDPDCLKCETSIAFHNGDAEPCSLAFYFWSKPANSVCSDDGEWVGINFADWLVSLGGLITQVEVNSNDVKTSATITSLPGQCVGKKLTITLGDISFPPETITTLTFNAGNNTYTYTSEDGTQTVISDIVTTLTFNAGTGLYTYTSEDGTTTDFGYPPFIASSVANGEANTIPGQIFIVNQGLSCEKKYVKSVGPGSELLYQRTNWANTNDHVIENIQMPATLQADPFDDVLKTFDISTDPEFISCATHARVKFHVSANATGGLTLGDVHTARVYVDPDTTVPRRPAAIASAVVIQAGIDDIEDMDTGVELLPINGNNEIEYYLRSKNDSDAAFTFYTAWVIGYKIIDD